MNETKFYQPRLTKLAGKTLMFAQKVVGKEARHAAGNDAPDFDFVGSLAPAGIPSYINEAEADFSGTRPPGIMYNFSHAIRRNIFPSKGSPSKAMTLRRYGAGGMSFSALYALLCDAYNGGRPFIDTYFEFVFPSRPVYSRFQAIYETIQDSINNEQLELFMRLPKLRRDGTPDRRYKASKRFMDYKAWQDPIIKQDCRNLAKAIRHDIEVCLSTGMLPLRGKENPVVSARTAKLRSELGGMVSPDRLFYASGQLIRHLNIYVEAGGMAA